MTDLIKVSSFTYRQDAEIAKGILEENGINSFISSDDLAGLRPHMTLTGEGVILVIARQDLLKAQEALKILENPLEDDEKDEEFESFKLSLDAKAFPLIVLNSIATAAIAFWFIWHSLHLEGNPKIVIISAAIGFALLTALGSYISIRSYKARKKYNERNR